MNQTQTIQGGRRALDLAHLELLTIRAEVWLLAQDVARSRVARDRLEAILAATARLEQRLVDDIEPLLARQATNRRLLEQRLGVIHKIDDLTAAMRRLEQRLAAPAPADAPPSDERSD
jgi:hypothetical protein